MAGMPILRDRGLESELAVAKRRIAELEEQITQVAKRDPLAADLLTLRTFRAQLEMDIKRSHRYRHPMSLAVLDLDGFRALNLKHGYPVGDKVIAAVGRTIKEQTRANDLVCRTSGDEFAMLLPETEGQAAVLPMERILRSLEDLNVEGVRGISASIGLTALKQGEAAAELLAEAGVALEQARVAGGGRVSLNRGASVDEEEGAGHGDVVAALASALQERDSYTGDHSESVVEIAARVGAELGLDADEVGMVRTAALLHDIGKIGVPDEILHKPGPLDDREWEIMRRHPVTGERILRAIPGMGRIAKIVRHEHERWDGTGYPDRVAGEAIPLGARIILACDAYHAMTSDRPYRAAMTHPDAFAELNANAGTQFDPSVVEALIGYLYGLRQSGKAP
jgi:diguanylate cyclase (GGDEF)-like protein/putative nucleotidyltransferase with HDIG domain